MLLELTIFHLPHSYQPIQSLVKLMLHFVMVHHY